MVQCLLLEDLEEVTRFDGLAQLGSEPSPARSFSSPAELRLYKSNLAVLPTQATGFQWRLADIDAVKFDEANYAVVLESGRRAPRGHETRQAHPRIRRAASRCHQRN